MQIQQEVRLDPLQPLSPNTTMSPHHITLLVLPKFPRGLMCSQSELFDELWHVLIAGSRV